MNRYRFTPTAANDLEEIYEYIASKNLPAAGRLIVRLTSEFAQLAETPGMGRSRAELRAGLRSIADGNYVIFYRIVDTVVQIVRVLHGARDIEAIFRETAGDDE